MVCPQQRACRRRRQHTIYNLYPTGWRRPLLRWFVVGHWWYRAGYREGPKENVDRLFGGVGAPRAAIFLAASYDFRAAHHDSVHPWEGSDVGGHMAAANMSLLIGLIFALMLANVSMVGYRRGRSKDLTNR